MIINSHWIIILMSRYNKLIEPENVVANAPPESEIIIPPRSNLLENEAIEEEAANSLKRLRKFCNVMIFTCFIIPLLSWFIDPYHFVFYQSLIILVMQIYVAVCGIKSTRNDYYNRLQYFRKIVHAFYLYFLISLILNQIAAILISSDHNYKDCGVLVNNRVCVNRTGLMTTQLVTLLYSPGLDLSVWIFYRYLLTVMNDCEESLRKPRI